MILVLGDIHGRTIWKDIIAKENPDLTIFLGDYVTTHADISPLEQITNMEEIFEYKEANPDKVILLRGNHDCESLGYDWAECYPTEPKVKEYMSKPEFREYFLRLTQWIYIDEDLKTIFSHAGISNIWMLNSKIESIYDINKLVPSPIWGFTPNNYFDNYGDSTSQPPTWIRPQTLITCNIDNWDQVVGHTVVNQLTKVEAENKQSIWLCDALEARQYLTINNNKFETNEC